MASLRSLPPQNYCTTPHWRDSKRLPSESHLVSDAVDIEMRIFFHVVIGLLLREKTVHNPNTGSHWTISLLFSLVQELVPLYDIANDELEGGDI